MFRKGILVHPEELTLNRIHEISESGLDTLGLHPAGGLSADRTLQDAIDARHTPGTEALFAEACSLGITVEYEAHVMRWLLPASEFAENPHLFRMNGEGVRTPDMNLCVSSPEALDYVSERAAVLTELLDTGTDECFYWMDDALGGACRCEKCAGLTPSEQQLTVLNAMIKGIRKVRPNAKLCYLAYNDTLDVPKRVEPEDGIFLEFAPFRRDPHAPISDSGNERNAREIRPLRELISFFGKANSRVLEYWMDNSMYSGWKKPPKRFTLDEDVMKADVDFYAGLGFETITSFGCYLGEDYRQLYGEPPIARYGEILNGK